MNVALLLAQACSQSLAQAANCVAYSGVPAAPTITITTVSLSGGLWIAG